MDQNVVDIITAVVERLDECDREVSIASKRILALQNALQNILHDMDPKLEAAFMSDLQKTESFATKHTSDPELASLIRQLSERQPK